MRQGSRVRPNFSKVRLKKICCSPTDTLGSYRGLNQSEMVKGRPPSDWPWSRYSCRCLKMRADASDSPSRIL